MDDRAVVVVDQVDKFPPPANPLPPPCPICQGTRWRLRKGRSGSWVCRDCDAKRVALRDRAGGEKSRSGVRPCLKCGAADRFPSGECRPCNERGAADRGQRILARQYPAYTELLLATLPEAERTSYFANVSKNHHVRPLAPSRVFPGLSPTLDERLIREGRAQDVACCQAVAQVPQKDQREFYERHLKNPALAQRWARVERYKRPLIAGDKQDDLIWKLFTIIRLQMEMLAEGRTWALAGVGRSLVQQAGFLDAITERRRLVEVLSTYGSMLAHGEDVGDVMHPPWPADNPRKDR